MQKSLKQSIDNLLSKLQGWFDTAVAMVPNFILAILVVVGMGFLSRWVCRWSERALDKVTKNDALVSLASTIVRLTVIAIGVFIALSLLHLEKTVTSMLAGLGVLGLALGFAFQDIASNFMSGIFLALRGPFENGDIIEIKGHIGTVVDVQLRRTVLQTFDGLAVIVPNKELFQNTLVNYTRTKERRVSISCGVGYSEDLQRVEEVVTEAFADFEMRDSSRELQFIFTEFGDSSINFELRFWLPKSAQGEFLEARSKGIMRVKQAMDAANLPIPFPIRTLDFGARAVGGERLDDLRLRLASSDA